MSYESSLEAQQQQLSAEALSVILRLSEPMPSSDRSIKTIASLQRIIRDQDRKTFGGAAVSRSRQDGHFYIDMPLAVSDRRTALTEAVGATTNALLQTPGTVQLIETARIGAHDPQLETPFAWVVMDADRSSDATAEVQSMYYQHRDAVFPVAELAQIDAQLSKFYQ